METSVGHLHFTLSSYFNDIKSQGNFYYSDRSESIHSGGYSFKNMLIRRENRVQVSHQEVHL